MLVSVARRLTLSVRVPGRAGYKMMSLRCACPGMGNSHLPAISMNCIAIYINSTELLALHAFQHRLRRAIRVDLADVQCSQCDRHQAIACSRGWIQAVQSNDAKSSVLRPGSKVGVQVITTTCDSSLCICKNQSKYFWLGLDSWRGFISCSDHYSLSVSALQAFSLSVSALQAFSLSVSALQAIGQC
jgi:hypothetical protein